MTAQSCLQKIAAIVVVSGLSLVSLTVHAFTLMGGATSGELEGWSNRTVSFKLNTAHCPANIDSILEDAMAVWNSVPSSDLIVEQRGLTTTTVAQLAAGTATDVPVIICDPTFSTNSGTAGNGVPAVARVAVPVNGGPLTYAYLLINVQPGAPGNILSQDADQVKIGLAHELGHVLGLGDTMDRNALMSFDSSARRKLSLGQDDIDGITYLYPRNELNGKAMGCGMVTETSGRGGPPTAWQALAMLLFFGLPMMVFARLKQLKV